MRKPKQSAVPVAAEAARLRQVLELYPSQAAMARALAVPQGHLSLTLNGKRAAGRALLLGLARHTAVDLRWLLTGRSSSLADG